MNLEKSAALLDIKSDELNSFDVLDTFNNNQLRGYISRRSDYRYGAMVITHVNDKLCPPQIIYGTPKIKYPFDRNGMYRFPKMIRLQAFEKLDGTNILAYHYKDFKCHDYISYKLRLSPVVKANKYGDFLSMWCEILDTNQWIEETMINYYSEWNLSFEMYGSRNPITIKYDTPLDVALLFGIRSGECEIRPVPTDDLFIKIPMVWDIYQNDLIEPEKCYSRLRSIMSGYNTGGDKFRHEGVVLYAYTEDNIWKQFKCKPEEIERIHWASGIISPIALWTTALNTFESYDNPDRDDFITLLKEEYSSEQIGNSSPRIVKTWGKAWNHVKLVALVNSAWDKARKAGFDICEDKNGTMRFLSQFFNKRQMSKIGTIILRQAGLIK